MSVQFEILRSYLYRLVIVHVSLSFWGRTYIDRPSSCQFEFEFSSWDRTYIDRSLSCQYEFEFSRPHPYRLVIVMSIQFEFSGMHLYRSIIHLVSLVFGTTPISIGHLPVSLCLVRVGIAPISIGHSCYLVSLT